MLAPVTTEQMLEQSRVFALRAAIVAALAAHFLDVEVRSHPGKLDMSDVLAKDLFAAPSILIAATRLDNDDRLSGSDDLRVHLSAYVVAEDLSIGEPRRLVTRDEIGLALCEAVILSLSDPDFSAWGVMGVGSVENVQWQPLFTARSWEMGTVYYAVTWTQILYALGEADFFTGGDQT